MNPSRATRNVRRAPDASIECSTAKRSALRNASPFVRYPRGGRPFLLQAPPSTFRESFPDGRTYRMTHTGLARGLPLHTLESSTFTNTLVLSAHITTIPPKAGIDGAPTTARPAIQSSPELRHQGRSQRAANARSKTDNKPRKRPRTRQKVGHDGAMLLQARLACPGSRTRRSARIIELRLSRCFGQIHTLVEKAVVYLPQIRGRRVHQPLTQRSTQQLLTGCDCVFQVAELLRIGPLRIAAVNYAGPPVICL